MGRMGKKRLAETIIGLTVATALAAASFGLFLLVGASLYELIMYTQQIGG